jgi:hypothetical protein
MELRVSRNEDLDYSPVGKPAGHFYAPKLVLQKKNQCGQTCVAIITHLPVEMICAEFKRRGGTTVKDVSGMLRWYGWESDVTVTRLRDYRLLPQLCVMDLAVKGRSWSGHFAVFFEGTVYEPGFHIPVPVATYFQIYPYMKLRGFIKVEVHPSFYKK